MKEKTLRLKTALRAVAVILMLGSVGIMKILAQSLTQGGVGGMFTVNANGDKVVFSQGNLQYIGSANIPYWKFADHQWEYLGNNEQGSVSYNIDRDLFAWATSGYNHGALCYQPYSTSNNNSDYYAYGNSSCCLFDQSGQADWGYNAISNGGNQEHIGWRTLSKNEWEYLFKTRSTLSGIRYVKAVVNSINGVILLPDDWNISYYKLNNVNSNGSYSNNIISETQWITLEKFGAIFLPAAGYRNGTSVNINAGAYWSSTSKNNYDAYCLYFSNGNLYVDDWSEYRKYGQCVRLVYAFQNYSFGINATTHPVEGGNVGGVGLYSAGSNCTLTATASEDYIFYNWTENGIAVSSDANYTFPVSRDRNLVATFLSTNPITFVDENVKDICVTYWDTNDDGELSYAEAAEITSLDNVFRNKTAITSFNELQYFVSLNSITEEDFYGCTSLTQVTIPQNVTIIGERAFWNCPVLQTVYFNAIHCTIMQTTYNNNTYSVFSSNANGAASSLTRVVIGNGVECIPNYAFKDCEDIYQRLVIPATVTEIGDYSFYGCSSLPIMVIQGDILQTIGRYAFYNCSSLRSTLNIPNSVTSIGTYAFYGCLSLPSLTIGEGVTEIGSYAFWNCPNLVLVNFNATECSTMITPNSYVSFSVFNSGTSDRGSTPIVVLNIGENVTKIPEFAFRNSTNITNPIIIPDATKSIGRYAFDGAGSSELTIGRGVKTIGEYAFRGCTNLITVNFNATNCTQMGNYMYPVFGDVTSIETLTIGSDVSNIPAFAFQNSTSLTSPIIIPNATTTIGDKAFYGAGSSELTIGTAIKEIGSQAFVHCPNLTTVIYNATNCTQMKTKYNSDDYCSVFSGNGAGGATPIINLTIGDNVTRIPDYAFYNSPNIIGTLDMPSDLNYIGKYAFYGCCSLTGNLLLNNNLTVIKEATFEGCSHLSGALVLPTGLTSIDDYAFKGCCGFTGSLIIPNNINDIGYQAFYGCTNIQELTIGEGITIINGAAFWYCPNITKVNFNAINCSTMVSDSQYSVFSSGVSSGESPIVSLTIGDKVTKIPDYAFRNSPNIQSFLIIPDNVSYIGNYAFYNSRFKGDLVIPNATTTLGSYAFYNCSGFDGSLILGSGIQTINQNTFDGCSGFCGSLIIGRVVNSIGNYAFHDCNSFTSLITENPAPPIASDESFKNMTYTIPVYVPYSVISDYRTSPGWNLFTNYKEQCVFELLDDNLWSNEINWYAMELPSTDDVVCINSDCMLDIDATVLHLYVLNINDCLTINNGKTLTVTNGLGILKSSQLALNNGGQLVSNTTGVNAIVKKDITQWMTSPDNGWHAISSPVNNVAFDNVANLTSSDYNVYRLNETIMTWENSQNSGNIFTSFANGRGYLYRKGDNTAIEFNGTLNTASVNYSLSYTTTGFHLIGNPYPHIIYKGLNAAIPNTYLEDGFYTLTSAGGWVAGTDNTTAIAPCQAVLVQAKSSVTDEDLVITKTTATGLTKSNDDNIMFIVSNSNYEDVAYALFKDGHGLNKIDHRNADIQKLYIQHNGEDFAIANLAEDVQDFNLNFHAATTGKYTLNVKADGNFSYLHLIDNLTGADIDLLLENEYSFIGASSDKDNRFIVKLKYDSTANDDDEIFAYQNGNEIVVNGEGNLQLYDILGRYVMNREINGVETVDVSSLQTGVYILRMTGNSIKTQKIVVK